MSRYLNKRIFQANAIQSTKDLLETRGLTNARIIETALSTPLSVEERKQFSVRTVIWQRRTRLFKIAFELYGDSRLWWIIAWFNQKPTDADYSVGDRVLVPFPLEQIYERFV